MDDLHDDILNLQTDIGDTQQDVEDIKAGFGFDSALGGTITLGEWIHDFFEGIVQEARFTALENSDTAQKTRLDHLEIKTQKIDYYTSTNKTVVNSELQCITLSTNTIMPDTGSILNLNANCKMSGALWVNSIVPYSDNILTLSAENVNIGALIDTTTIEIKADANIDITTDTLNLLATDLNITGEQVNIDQGNFFNCNANTNLYGSITNIGNESGDILNVKSGSINIGLQANTGSCEISTNTNITLRTATTDLICDTTNISGSVYCGNPAQTTNKVLYSYGELISGIMFTLKENALSAKRDVFMYATKLTGAISDGLGTLNIWCKNIIYTNINNIYYKTSTASGFNDVSCEITAGVGGNNSGQIKTIANVIDLEANTVYIGRDIASDVYVRGDLYCERLFSADGQIDMSNAILAQF